jgi:hypothetical protein
MDAEVDAAVGTGVDAGAAGAGGAGVLTLSLMSGSVDAVAIFRWRMTPRVTSKTAATAA